MTLLPRLNRCFPYIVISALCTHLHQDHMHWSNVSPLNEYVVFATTIRQKLNTNKAMPSLLHQLQQYLKLYTHLRYILHYQWHLLEFYHKLMFLKPIHIRTYSIQSLRFQSHHQLSETTTNQHISSKKKSKPEYSWDHTYWTKPCYSFICKIGTRL